MFEGALRDHALIERHIEALYTTDSAGRLLRVREPNGGPAPRFFVCRGAIGVAHRFRVDVPLDIRRELEAAVAETPIVAFPTDGGNDAREELSRLAAILNRSTPVTNTSAGPAFAFPNEVPTLDSDDGAIVQVTDANVGVLDPLLQPWAPDIYNSPPLFALTLRDQAVAVCGSVRITAHAHEAGVETAPAHRGRGYAARVVAAWAKRVRALGVEPLYSTSWENAASRTVACKLRLVHFGNDLHLT
ncbi:MAG TPA: GNAT family N-acetyltransferase [Gemmatimonadaceae bacterium]|nr:GNAT family N-acetyltransferase [Gemmatimonadaceae bacterium]